MFRDILRLSLLVNVLLWCAVPTFAAAKKDAEKENLAWMEAGKPDALRAFQNQAKSALKPGAIPQFIGEYLWSGRADDKYKPFFMFELRLQGAAADLQGVNYRIVTLTHERKPLTAGDWVNLGTLKNAEKRDLSYKLNCPNFPAFQIEVKWMGGEEAYLVWDKVATVPVAVSDVAKVSFLVSVNQIFEHDIGKKMADVSYMIWNIGGLAAKNVEQTIILKDSNGKDVYSHKHTPNKGEIPGGYVGEQKLKLSKVPEFAILAINTKTADVTSLDPGSYSGAKDIEIADVKADGSTLHAKVRNGLGGKISGLVVTITLIERNGKLVKRLRLPVGDMNENQISPISADISGVKSWTGYEVSWESSELPTEGARNKPTNNAASKPPELEVDGLVFVVTSSTTSAKGVDISGVLHNRRDNDLNNLIISFSLPNGKSDNVVVTLKPGKLDKGKEVEVNFTADGVKEFTGLGLKWVSLN